MDDTPDVMQHDVIPSGRLRMQDLPEGAGQGQLQGSVAILERTLLLVFHESDCPKSAVRSDIARHCRSPSVENTRSVARPDSVLGYTKRHSLGHSVIGKRRLQSGFGSSCFCNAWYFGMECDIDTCMVHMKASHKIAQLTRFAGKRLAGGCGFFEHCRILLG